MFKVIIIAFGKEIILSGKGGSVTESECELMQYTGLKDKNGVEIYEGDIMKYNEIGIVCFGEFESFHEGGCSRYHFHQGFYIVDRNNKQLRDKVNEDINWKQYKVIGNIYENKDLIK